MGLLEDGDGNLAFGLRDHIKANLLQIRSVELSQPTEKQIKRGCTGAI